MASNAEGRGRMRTLSLDFETSSSTDLKKVGASKYSKSSDLAVTVVAWAFDNEPVQSVILPKRDELPKEIKTHLEKGGLLAAWNAAFECAILQNYFGVTVNKDAIVCTMQRALYAGLPASLGDAGPALGLDIVKDKSAERLMREMAKPNRKGLFQFEDTEKLEALAAYCRKDVEAERAIAARIPKLTINENRVSKLDRKANNHGVRIDKVLINKMIELAAAETKLLNARATELTNGAVTSPGTQTAKVLQFFREGKAPPTLSKQNVAEALKSNDLTPQERELLELRQLAAKSSVKKLQAALNAAEDDDAIRGMLSYYGASRTGRWSGKGAGGFQPQNLPRPSIKDPDAAINDILAGNDISHHGSTLDVISSCLRGVIIPRHGKKFATVDLAQIEARVLPYLAGQDDILEVFASGQDVYTHTAKKLGSDNRTLGKVLVLACGYGMGASKFKDTAKTYGLTLSDEEAENAVKSWRDASDKITALWRKAGKAVKDAINNPDKRKPICKGVSACASEANDGLLLRIKLPSGRELFYRNALLNEDDEITYAGSNQKTRKWESIRTYGGKLVENIVQAVARDVIASIALRIDELSIGDLILTIHDEVIIEVDADKAAEKYHEINRIMHTAPQWALGLPLGADGHIQSRYGKGGDAPPPLVDDDDVEADVEIDEDEIELEIDEMPEQEVIMIDMANVLDGIDFRRPNEAALEVALKFAEAGAIVFPCRSDKVPVVTEYNVRGKDGKLFDKHFSFSKDSSKDPETIKRWFLKDYKEQATMVGLPCGANNLVVIDPDRPKPEKKKNTDGLALFERLIAENNIDLSSVPVIVSPTLGRHYIFAQPNDGQRFSSHAGGLPDNIDVKGDNGYVIASGSRRPDGRAYEQLKGTPELLEAIKNKSVPQMPDKLRKIIQTHSPAAETTKVLGFDPWPRAFLEHVFSKDVLANDSGVDYVKWQRMCAALKAASGGENWGYDIFCSWSEQNAHNNPTMTETVWRTTNTDISTGGRISEALKLRGFIKLRDQAESYLARSCLQPGASTQQEPVVGFNDIQIQPYLKQPISLEDNPYFKELVWAGDKNRQSVKYLVKGLITANGLTFIAGQPNAGKSAVAVNLALCLSKGLKFAGKRVKQPTGVIYIAAEAPASIMDRIEATKDALFIADEAPAVAVLKRVDNLADREVRRTFIQALKGVVDKMQEIHGMPVGAFIIDTMARAFEMDDENSAAEMGRLVRAVDEMAEAIGGCARIVIHHMGKDSDKGMRGSTALLGAADDELDVIVPGTTDLSTIQITHKKSRNFARAQTMGFKLRTIKLGVDEDGDEMTTVAAEFTGAAEVKEKLSDRAATMLAGINEDSQRYLHVIMGSKNYSAPRDELIKKGLIVKAGDFFELTDKGRKHV